MSLIFNRDTLLSALEKVCSIATQKKTFAVLSSFLVEVKNGKCLFTTTDMTDIMQLTVEAKTDGDCAFLLKARETLDIVKGLPKGEILFDLDSSYVRITCGNFKANMNLYDVTEFPNVIIDDISTGLNFKSLDLKNALNQVSQFASNDITRIEFCGVNFGYKFNNKKAIVTLVATDGHRLAKTELYAEDIKAEEPKKNGYIISTKAVSLISKFFLEEKNVLFSIKQNKQEGRAIFKGENITIVTSMISGEYPDFSTVIPETNNNIIVDKNTLISSLKRSALFNPKQLTTMMEFSKNNINIHSSGQMGNMSDDVECKFSGEKTIIGVNAKYLEQSLSIVEDSFAVIGVVDQYSPIIVMGETDFDAHNFGTLSVVMPMIG